MILNAKEVKKFADANGIESAKAGLAGCLERHRTGETGGVDPKDISLRDLYEEFCGYEALRELDPRRGSDVTEAVDTGNFSTITGQIIYSAVHSGYMQEGFVFSRLIPDVPTSFLDGEKIPGLTPIADEAELVGEGEEFPEAGFGAMHTKTPATQKRGMVVSITKEAIFADRIGMVLNQGNTVGQWLGTNKEKRLVDLAIGATNNYERNDTASDTYQTASPWINDHSNELTDWEELEAAWLLLRQMTDPDSTEPIMINATDIVVGPAKAATLNRILSATQIRNIQGANETISGNPIGGMLGSIRRGDSQLMTSRVESELSVSAANSKLYWLLGDFSKAFAYMTNFPLRVERQNASSELAFSRDIVARFKASERGVAAVMDPRYVIRNTN